MSESDLKTGLKVESNFSQLEFDSNYTNHESSVQKYWDEINLISLLESARKNGKKFTFMDGPPFVSGSLHLGHGSIFSEKSAVCNAFGMMGYDTSYKLGFDCHGLPIEAKVCKEHNLTTQDVDNMGLANFNELCDKMITEVSGSWEPLFKKLGRNANFQNTYMTRDLTFMETTIWIFSELYKKNLVYQGNKVMSYSSALETPLSNFEAGQNYKEINTKSVYVKFKALSEKFQNTYFVAWTTTPWTLPSNLALCVNAGIDYVLIEDLDDKTSESRKYIISKNSIQNLYGKKRVSKVKILQEFKGSELEHEKYSPVFQYMSNLNEKLNRSNDPFFKILCNPYVKDEGIGTGIVHQAPAFGEDDFKVCASYGLVDNKTISDYCPITSKCCYTEVVSDYEGLYVLDADDKIRMDLTQAKHVIKTQDYSHSYPHCYRTDTPLVYRTVKSFFIQLGPLKDRMVELNKQVNWHPQEIGTNRFGNWLENAKDWAVSRFRYYGTPIPVWVNVDEENGEEDMIVVGSIDELAELAGLDRSTITNLHPEHLNSIKIVKDGKIYSRVPDIFDCWFESGAVPFGQIHYPFNKEASNQLRESEFLSDFICEGLDQTRGWFYTLLVLSTAILDKAPFRNVICAGLVLDEKGEKLSKKLGNYEDPEVIIDEFGADVVRCYFIRSPLMRAEPLLFSKNAIHRLKSRFSPYLNGFKFLIENMAMYHINNNISDESRNIWGTAYYDLDSKNIKNLFDVWILNRTIEMAQQVNQHINKFNLGQAVDILIDSFEDLTNSYIKMNRDRLKGNKGTDEMKDSLQTLYTVLLTYVQLFAPFTPFMSEYLFLKLNSVHTSKDIRDKKSVLLTSYPNFLGTVVDQEKMTLMKDLQRVCLMVRTIRANSDNHTSLMMGFKLCTISHSDVKYLEKIRKYITLFSSELNVEKVNFKVLDKQASLYELKCNEKEIGQIYRKDSTKIKTQLMNLDQDVLRNIFEGGSHTISVQNSNQNPDPNQSNSTYDVELMMGSNLFTIKSIPVKTDSKYVFIDSDLKVEVDPTCDEASFYKYNLKMLKSAIQAGRKYMKLKPWDGVNVILDERFRSIDKNFMIDIEKLLPMDSTNLIVGSFSESDIAEILDTNNTKVSDISDKEYIKLAVKDTSSVLVGKYSWRKFTAHNTDNTNTDNADNADNADAPLFYSIHHLH